jgi:hypothetical protein
LRKGVLVALCGAFVATIALPGSAPAGDGRTAGPAVLALEDARGFESFALFWVGESFEGMPLTTILRREDTAELVSFVYGDCEAGDEAGCAPPMEVQVWPACRRHLGLYREGAIAGPGAERVVVRGVPGALLDGGARLELQTADATVVVFAGSSEQASRTVSALRPLRATMAVGAALPPPLPGAVDGRLACR